MLRPSFIASCMSLCAASRRSPLPGQCGGQLPAIKCGGPHLRLAATSRVNLITATSAPPGRGPLEIDEELIEEDNVSNARLVLTILRRRLPSLVKPNFAKARLAFSSVVTQVGAQAFLFVSSILAIAAVFIEQVARRLRRFDASGAAWVWLIGPARLQAFVAKRQEQLRNAIGRLKYEAMAGEMFDEVADLDRNGGVDRTELYCLCLRLYLAVTQYLPQVLTPPTKAQTDALFARFDTDANGRLDKEEFLLLASLLMEMVSMRIAAQSAISLVLAPLAAATLVPYVGALPVSSWLLPGRPLGLRAAESGRVGGIVTSALTALATMLPSQLRAIVATFIGSRAVAITATAAIFVSLLVPFTLSLIDEYYTLRSARTAARALRAARRRRLELRSVST